MESPGHGQNELRRIDEMCSERWDSPDDRPPRFHYVMLAGRRTRSGLLCDYLGQHGIGAPNEYFHLQYMERIAARLGCLLIVYRDEAEISERRADYDAHLESLSDHISPSRLRGDLAAALGSSLPFFLGRMVCRIMADRYPAARLSEVPWTGERPRIGLVSAYSRWHTVWKLLINGWLSQLDQSRFDVCW